MGLEPGHRRVKEQAGALRTEPGMGVEKTHQRKGGSSFREVMVAIGRTNLGQMEKAHLALLVALHPVAYLEPQLTRQVTDYGGRNLAEIVGAVPR